MNTREAFEAWISAPPYEKNIRLSGPEGAWKDQYALYQTQLAWEAWQAAWKTASREAHHPAVLTDDRAPYGAPFEP